MNLRPSDHVDQELIDEAVETLASRGRDGYHSVAAALQTATGARYISLDLRSRKSAICAEPGAIAAAHTAGDYAIERIVAVYHSKKLGRPVVISPCGSCRELIYWHAPDCRVVVETDGRRWQVRAREFFTFPEIPTMPRREPLK